MCQECNCGDYKIGDTKYRPCPVHSEPEKNEEKQRFESNMSALKSSSPAAKEETQEIWSEIISLSYGKYSPDDVRELIAHFTEKFTISRK